MISKLFLKPYKYVNSIKGDILWNSNIVYYLSIVIPILITGFIFFIFFKDSYNGDLESTSDYTIFILKFFWFSGIVVTVTNIIGLVWFGNPEKSNRIALEKFKNDGWNSNNYLIVVYVSRGDNSDALKRSISITEEKLIKYKVKYRIDVVTDIQVEDKLDSNSDSTLFHLIPNSYETIRGAKWKARALHYVVDQHKQDNYLKKKQHSNIWILHLDEESQITESCIAGISEFISNPKNSNTIGQGEIKYNAYNYGKNIIITWSDCIRSGDDLGRFRFQYGIFKKPFFGMHGSYILVPLKIEQRFGFDLGGKGSVTEDAYFALKCAEAGITFKWVNGYIREQSPFDLKSIAKQRRRWLSGLLTLSFDKEIGLSTRLPLMINTILWTTAWIGPLVTLGVILFGGFFPLPLLIIAALLQGSYTSVYMIGAMRNISDLKKEMSITKKLYIYFGSMVGTHIASLVEGISVIYGLSKPVKTFDVIDKN